MAPNKKKKVDELHSQYLKHFSPSPYAVRKRDERAFEIYYAWSVLPADAPVVVRTVTTTRSEEIAVSP